MPNMHTRDSFCLGSWWIWNGDGTLCPIQGMTFNDKWCLVVTARLSPNTFLHQKKVAELWPKAFRHNLLLLQICLAMLQMTWPWRWGNAQNVPALSQIRLLESRASPKGLGRAWGASSGHATSVAWPYHFEALNVSKSCLHGNCMDEEGEILGAICLADCIFGP